MGDCFAILSPHGRLAQRLAQVLYTHKAGGSNPSSPTIELETVLERGPFLFGPISWDSNPQGCGAEETRKRFPAQHARAAGPKRKRAAKPHADIPHRPPLNWKRSSQGDRFCLRPVHGIRTRQHVCRKGRGLCRLMTKRVPDRPKMHQMTHRQSGTRSNWLCFTLARPKRPTGSRSGCPRRPLRTRATEGSAAYVRL